MVEPAASQRPLLLAIDGNSLVHRAFHSQAATGLRAPDGRPLWAIRGLLTQLVAAVERVGPAAVVVGFDDPDTSVRKDKWPQYKAGRVDKLDTLVCQLREAVEVLRAMGVAVVVPPGLEADDVLASAARFAREAGGETVIATSDRDAFALIDDTTRVLRIINGGVDASPLLTPSRFMTMQGITPAQYRDFAALRGDPSDNLPGVRGFGPKTAGRLLAARRLGAGGVRGLGRRWGAGDRGRRSGVGGPAGRAGHPDGLAAELPDHDHVRRRAARALLRGRPGRAAAGRRGCARRLRGLSADLDHPGRAAHAGPPGRSGSAVAPAQVWSGDRFSSSGGRRLPPLPKKKPETQLALF